MPLPRISTSFPEDLHRKLTAQAAAQFRPATSIIRQAVATFLNSDDTPTTVEDDYRTAGDPRTVGAGQIIPLRSRASSEWGHLVSTSDGYTVRVLPDGHTSGKKRSHTISQALTDAEARTPGDLTVDVLVGRLWRAGISRFTVEQEPDE